MVLAGHVQNGKIVSDDAVELPEGMSVRMEVFAQNTPSPPVAPRQGGRYAGQIWMADDFDEWPVDLQEALGMIP